MEGLEPFPEITSLGRHHLQQLCDGWVRTRQAAEFGVARVTVTPDCLGLEPGFFLHASNYDTGETLHFPFDKVVEHIIDHGCPEALRESLKERLRGMRRKAGVTVFQRYKLKRQVYTMALRCPACSQPLLSQYRIFEGQVFSLTWVDPVTCPNCAHVFPVTDEDFFPVIAPEKLDSL